MSEFTPIDKVTALNRISPEFLDKESRNDEQYLKRLLQLDLPTRRPLRVGEVQVVMDSMMDYIHGVRRTAAALGASGEIIVMPEIVGQANDINNSLIEGE